MLGKEALVVLINLSQLMEAKMEESILHVQGWANGWILIAVVISYIYMIHGSHLTSPLRDRDMEWKLGLVLVIA